MEQPLNDSHSFPFLVTQKGLREYNYEFIKIGTNFVTKDVLEARNSTVYNDTSFWTTIPQSEAENVPIFKKINDRINCQKLPQVEAIRSAYLVQTGVFPESNYREYFENSYFDYVMYWYRSLSAALYLTFQGPPFTLL